MRASALTRWVTLACCAGCTGFVGVATADATADLDVAATDRPRPDAVVREEGDALVACGVRTGDCDPVLDRGCAGEQTCRITRYLPLTTRCGPAGETPFGGACEGDDACAAGLACVVGRCLTPCCAQGGDTRCGEPGSHCGLMTDNAAISACTQGGECDYLAGDYRGGCGDGAGCFAMNSAGQARCLPLGSARLGAPCTLPNDCVLGLGCVFLDRNRGECRRLCRRGASSECASGTACQLFNGRPADWGFCA